MKIETLEVAGFRPALKGMRNPMDSWGKADSAYALSSFGTCDSNGFHVHTDLVENMIVGDADKDLSMRLQKAGPEHCKHLRMIQVWADITAPRYWWMEFDTYRAGVEKVSCSTMHKLMARPLTKDDFERSGLEDLPKGYHTTMLGYLMDLNAMMDWYKGETDPDVKKAIWRDIIQYLPQSYLQKRTVMMSYAALRNIYSQREGHKLKEWQQFREWIESLPESWMITE